MKTKNKRVGRPLKPLKDKKVQVIFYVAAKHAKSFKSAASKLLPL